MDAELMEKARAGLQGWQDGDLTALEELLDPHRARVHGAQRVKAIGE